MLNLATDASLSIGLDQKSENSGKKTVESGVQYPPPPPPPTTVTVPAACAILMLFISLQVLIILQKRRISGIGVGMH